MVFCSSSCSRDSVVVKQSTVCHCLRCCCVAYHSDSDE